MEETNNLILLLPQSSRLLWHLYTSL